jgi:glycosyltransferase involved in cell wall biosynthesis
MMQRISFIITSRNESKSILEATITGLLSTSARYATEIIVIDDGSSVPIAGLCRDVRLFRNPEPIGVSQSRRRGANIATGDVLVWLDAHMTFADNWLDQMLAHVESGSLLCSAAWDYNRSTCYCWGVDIEWCAERNYEKGLSPGFIVRHRTSRPRQDAAEVPMVIGSCYMMSRSSYNKLGGFSPLFRAWGQDDVDISIRAWISGLGVKCITQAAVGHLYRSKFPYPVEYDHLEFNQLVMIHSIFDESTIQMLEEYFKPLSAKVIGWLENVEPGLEKWREEIQSKRRLSDKELFRKFAPSIQHFLRRKHMTQSWKLQIKKIFTYGNS